MRYKIEACSIFETGKRVDDQGNPHQEDCIFPAHGELTGDDRLFILCDGMGGHSAGEVASAAVCRAMSETILAGRPDAEGPFGEDDFQAALASAYDALDACDDGAPRKMGTTMTLLKLHDGGYFVAHIGDSRVYHFRPGKDGDGAEIVFRTQDHSLVNMLLSIGELTEEQAKTFPRKNVITKAMQPGAEPRPKADIHQSDDIRAGDCFMLCSDGMLEDMDDDQLRLIFSRAGRGGVGEVGDVLTRATGGNRDNHSAIIVRIMERTTGGTFLSRLFRKT